MLEHGWEQGEAVRRLLLERGFAPRYGHVGTHREGPGGLWQQMGHQGLDSEQLQAKIREMAAPNA